LLDYYKVKLATKTGQGRRVAYRIARIRDLLGRNRVVTLLHDVRGFEDRRHAIAEAVNEMKTVHKTFHRTAEKMASASGNAHRLRTSVTDNDNAEFWELFDAAVEVAFQMTDSG